MPLPDHSERNISNLSLKKEQLQRALGLVTLDEETLQLVAVDEQHPVDEKMRQVYVDAVQELYGLEPSQFIDALSKLNTDLPVAKIERQLEVDEVWGTLQGYSPTLLGPRSSN